MAGTPFDAAVGALNGVVGDHLARHASLLAIRMALYHRGRPLVVDRDSLRATFARPSDKVCVLIHGIGATEACWHGDGEDRLSFGRRLHEDFGFTPLYLRYNSGLRVSQNGRVLAQLLEQLVEAYPVPLRQLMLIGHSLGGLLIRAACWYGDRFDHRWPELIWRAFYLGSPHLGAPLEKLGNVLSAVLSLFNAPVARAIRQVIDQRSVGIKDLRFGNLVDEDWLGHDPNALLDNRRVAVPLRDNTKHYLIGSTIARSPEKWAARLFGDGMVRVPSALGLASAAGAGRAGVPPENIRVLGGIAHQRLPHHPAVYDVIRQWCEADAPAR